MIAQRFVFTRSFLTEWNTDCLSEGRKFLVGTKIKRGIVILVRNAGCGLITNDEQGDRPYYEWNSDNGICGQGKGYQRVHPKRHSVARQAAGMKSAGEPFRVHKNKFYGATLALDYAKSRFKPTSTAIANGARFYHQHYGFTACGAGCCW